MTRAEHLKWCKTRALEYLPGDPSQAIASMMSDLGKHDETRDHGAIDLTGMLLIGGHLDGAEACRKHIDGFN